jgi:putative tributyrin esterase
MHFILLAVLALHMPAHIGAQADALAKHGRTREEALDSAALGRRMKYRVLVPQDYATSQRRYPVLYLLHGLGGDYTDWTSRTNIAESTRTLPLVIVMPDGENSWYAGPFEDYVTTELQADVARKYRVINSRYGRAIAGLSMGGYGALKFALKKPTLFAVAGSFSGALTATRAGDAAATRLGTAEVERLAIIFGPPDSEARKTNDVIALAATARAGGPYLYIDCGTSDPWLAGNRLLVEAFSTSGYPYEFHEVPGGHGWDYWDRRVREFLPLLMKKLQN